VGVLVSTAPVIEVLDTADDLVVRDLARLLPQVSSRAAPLTRDRLIEVLGCPGTNILVARMNDQIVGMALLLVLTTLTGQFGYVEEVVVDEAVRGQHVALALMEALVKLAEGLGLHFVELTSRPSREAANHLYRSLGFVVRETNVFRMALPR
jgi:ribosomal protein S18 acetylase RimI-like enzyme